jgi:hypothetical protein
LCGVGKGRQNGGMPSYHVTIGNTRWEELLRKGSFTVDIRHSWRSSVRDATVDRREDRVRISRITRRMEIYFSRRMSRSGNVVIRKVTWYTKPKRRLLAILTARTARDGKSSNDQRLKKRHSNDSSNSSSPISTGRYLSVWYAMYSLHHLDQAG